jgi:signal transduction histidine kinase
VERGEPERLVGICMDISTRRLAEEALRNSEKLAATGRLAATMAHEINNPLEGVTNLVFLARSDESLTAETREYLRLAEEELRRIGHIANRALVFYRDSASPRLVEVPQILDDVLNIFQNRIENKRLRVVRKYRGSSKLVCNAAEIRQVVSNILLNAIDASPKGGVLQVRVSPVNAACEAGVNGVRICVADYGPGIKTEHKDRIFEPFFTTKQDVGTGLGLWVSHGIVDKHQGRIQVRSSTRSGRSGTVFSIFIPSYSSVVVDGNSVTADAAQGAA